MTSPAPEAEPVLLSSEERAAINRENAQHSTGPRTDEGKQAVSMNAVKHGLYSKTLIIPKEDRAAYEAEGERLNSHYHPSTFEERELVQTIQDSRWRLNQVAVMIQNLYRFVEHQELDSIDEAFGDEEPETRRAFAQAAGLQANARLVDQLIRQEARFQRYLDNARRELVFHISQRIMAAREAAFRKQCQSERAKQSQPNAAPDAPQMPHFTGPLADIKRKQWIHRHATQNAAKSEA